MFWVLSVILDDIEFDFSRSRSAIMDSVAGRELLGQARSAAGQIDSIFFAHITEAIAWAQAPVIVNAAKAAHDRHVAEGFAEADVTTLEERFQDTKSLDTSPTAEDFLRRTVSASPRFTEIFFTDRSGFNVALTNPTSDFIQSDEKWWQNAWRQGVTIGDFEHDESAGTWSVAVAVRLDDPSTREPVGVMKAVMVTETIQKIADGAAEAVPGGRVRIATTKGVLIAEAVSGQERGLIANGEAVPMEWDDLTLPSAEGFAIHDDWLLSYARIGGSDIVAPAATRFFDLDWVVVLQQPIITIHNRIPVLDVIDDTLRSWQRMLAIGTVALVFLCAAIALTFAVSTARRYSNAVDMLRELAASAVQGRTASVIEIERPGEFVQLYAAVMELSRAYLSTLREDQQQR